VIQKPPKLSDKVGGDLSIVWASVTYLNFYACIFVTLTKNFKKRVSTILKCTNPQKREIF